MINDIFRNEGRGVCLPKYYHGTYAYARRMSPDVIKFREDSTTNQKVYSTLRDETIRLLYKKVNNYFKVFLDTIEPEKRSKALIITHMAYDLLSYKDFAVLDLLESHTGALKPRNLWSTKYVKMTESLELYL